MTPSIRRASAAGAFPAKARATWSATMAGWSLRRFVDHFGNCLAEFGTTGMMLGLAVHIAIWPDAVGASAFRGILEVLPPALLGWGFLIAGLARIAALIANGRSKVYGPWLRVIGALSGAMIWIQMCIALYDLVPTVGTPPSPGITVYFMLTIVELLSMYRAAVLVHHNAKDA